MEAPGQVDVEDLDELVAAGVVVVAADGGEERGDGDVAADDGVEDPFGAEVGDAFEGGGEGVDVGDFDRGAGGHALAGEEAEEGGFAGAVGWEGGGGVLVWSLMEVRVSGHTSDQKRSTVCR